MTSRRIILLASIAFGALLAGCGEQGDSGPLSEAESAAVLQMREEEKMARDVYLTLSPHDEVFSTIASSEQNHMDAVGNLLSRHGLSDPAAGQAAGSFSNQEIQKLYDQLVAAGNKSRLEALAVGVEIEELDLKDLDDSLAVTAQEDLRNVFGNLSRGSRNHLRTFSRKLTEAGGSYTPRHLDPAVFQSIINSPTESGGPND